MEIKKHKELPHSKSILIADKDAFETFLLTGHENLITGLYEDVYLTPDIYQHFVKNLDIKALKRFNLRKKLSIMPVYCHQKHS